MKYNFDEVIDRNHTNSIKYDMRKNLFGTADVIPFWVADMDFKTPDFIMEALRNRMNHEIFGYTSKPPQLTETITEWLYRRHGWQIHKNWITINPGVVPTLAFCVLAFTKPGDQIILQPPIYFPFFYVIENNGRKIINNPLVLQNGRYHIDFDDLRRKVSSRTKMIFLCNPHNPGGSVWQKEELLQLAEICIDYNLLIVSDEIHSDLILFSHKHVPMASLSKEIANRTITSLSTTKTFNTAGMSISYTVISNTRIRNDLSNMLGDFHLSYGNTTGLIMMEAAYRHGEEWLSQLLDYLEGNIEWLDTFLQHHVPEIKMIKPEGTYLAWLDFRELDMDQNELKKFLIHKAGLGFSDGASFGMGGGGFQRMNLACPRSLIQKGMKQLEDAIKKNNIEKK